MIDLDKIRISISIFHPTMAGSKRARVKKALSPRNDPPPPQITPEDDDDLMDDLLASLDSRNETVQAESSTVLQEMQEKREADVNSGKSSKERFKERQVRHLSAFCAHIHRP